MRPNVVPPELQAAALRSIKRSENAMGTRWRIGKLPLDYCISHKVTMS